MRKNLLLGFTILLALALALALFMSFIYNYDDNEFHEFHEYNSESWLRSSGNDDSNRYISLNQINKENLSELKVAWTYNSGINGVSQTTPIFTGKFLISASANFLYAINPKDGKEVWRSKFETEIAKRGLVFFKDLIYIPSSSGVFSVDPTTGKIIKKYGDESSLIAPVFHAKSIITGNYQTINSFDLKSEKPNWSLSLKKDNVRARVWSGMTYDVDTGFVFIATSNTGHIADQEFDNGGYANSIIAINSKNGKIEWQFQEIKHDLWDLDVVGQPIIADIMIDEKVIPSVIAVTKSGNTLFINKKTGTLVFDADEIEIPKYHNQSKYVAKKQLNIKLPEPFSSNYFNINSDITNLSEEKSEYVKFKLRNAKSNVFLPVSTDNDVVMYGLHGGAQWGGAALDPNKFILVVPSNKYPWILRAYPYANDEEKVISKALLNKSYMNSCAACHGNNLRGGFLWESFSDLYFPPLVDAAKRFKRSEFSSQEKFRKVHRYIDQIEKTKNLLPYPDGLKRIFDMVKNTKNENTDYSNKNYREIINSVDANDLDNIYSFLDDIKVNVIDKGEYQIKSFWQLLLDQDGLPGSKPPYGYLNAIDLSTGKIKWQKPFGVLKKGNVEIKGDMNHGGVLITAADIIFAGGTRDSKVRAFDLSNGNEIWESQVPAATSAPPMSYFHDGCQYVVFTATGGIFVGYNKKSDATVAYKLKTCE